MSCLVYNSFMTHVEKSIYNREKPIATEDVWRLVSETNRANKRTLYVNDFDNTLSSMGPSGGLMPFDTHLHPIAATALTRLHELGEPIGVISNRSTDQILRLYGEAKIKPSIISGSYGHVIAIPDSSESNGYRKIIDERFIKHSSAINAVQAALRNTLLSLEFIEGNPDRLDPEEIMYAQFGNHRFRIFVENKDPVEQLPYGLAVDYNMNELPPEERAKLVNLMREAANKAIEELKLPQDELEAFQKLWGIHKDSDHPEEEGNYTFKTRPLSSVGKGTAMMRSLREIENSGTLGDIGLVIYGGDHPRDDKSAMHASQLLESISGGNFKAVGVLVNPDPSSERKIGYSDLRMRGVPEYAGFLLTTSNILQYERRLLGVGAKSLSTD